MHFKSAVILCAVYFFTSVRSTGLHEDQIKKCIELYKNRDEKNIASVIARTMRNVFGIEYPNEVFKYDSKEPYHTHFTDLFLVLAYNGTITRFEDTTLMPFEVELYLKMFNKHAAAALIPQRGYLDRNQLSDVFKDLNINGKEKTEAVKLVPWSQVSDKGVGLCSAAELLLIMLHILPEGNGLNQSQIEDLNKLYKTDTACIDRLKIQEILIEFGMATESNKDLLLFKSNRPAAIVLMELMIITAERSKTVHKNETVLSTQEVRILISHFKKLDTDHDGLLSDDEAKQFPEGLLTNNPQDSIKSTGLNSGQIEKCIEVYKNREDIPNFMKQDFGIKNLEEFFQYKPNETYYINAMRSLMALAHAGTIDNFEEPTLMAIEVEFYVKKFFKRTEDTGQHGYLNREQLLSLFEDLNIQGDEMLKA
ncbi:uncharacterized protein LOC126835667 [Adelges cooleyi]|uniref:uncharacterized protein LOC126835667 n=1 Tax=Adelges cooleyi TaxID=133065 RepID=UPI00217F29D7|nr:uncharacterized protein LOC126835667 [Adelges cooleyi]